MPRLSIDIEARLASFQDSLDQVNRRTRDLTSGIESRFASLSRAFGLLGASLGGIGFATMVKGAIDAADNLGKLSQRVGVTVESLSALQYAAKLSDVSSEALADGLKKLSVNAQEAAVKGGDTARAFEQLGISQRELAQLAPEQLLRRVADAYAGIEDGAGKTANAVAIGGRSFNDLIPLLNQGARGLDSAADEARRFGLIVSGDAARAAETFNDNITRLQEGTRSLSITIANAVLPALNRMVEDLIEGERVFGSFAQALINLGTINPFRNVAENIRATRDEIAKLQAQLKREPGLFDESSQFGDGAIRQQLDAAQKRLEFLKSQQRRSINTNDPSNLDARDLAALEEGKKRVLQALVPEPKDVAAAGNSRGARYLAQIYLDQFQELQRQAREIQDDLRKQFDDGIDADIKAAEAFRDTLTRLLADTPAGKTQAIQTDLGILNDALIQGRISAEQYEEAFGNIQKRFEDLREAPRDVAQQIDRQAEAFDRLESAIRGWGNAFNEELVQGLKKGQLDFRKLVDLIITDIARLMVYRAITQPLFGAVSNFATYAFGAPGQAQNANYYQFGGKRAGGGPVMGGMAYLVGERGPELMVPSGSGTVVPNGALGGATVNVVINAPTDAAVIRSAVMQGVAMSNSQMGRAARIGALS